jgi:hypothetical protein
MGEVLSTHGEVRSYTPSENMEVKDHMISLGVDSIILKLTVLIGLLLPHILIYRKNFVVFLVQVM